MLLSNPSAFKVNDVTIALSTTDAVSDVATEEISRSSGARHGTRVQRGVFIVVVVVVVVVVVGGSGRDGGCRRFILTV